MVPSQENSFCIRAVLFEAIVCDVFAARAFASGVIIVDEVFSIACEDICMALFVIIVSLVKKVFKNGSRIKRLFTVRKILSKPKA